MNLFYQIFWSDPIESLTIGTSPSTLDLGIISVNFLEGALVESAALMLNCRTIENSSSNENYLNGDQWIKINGNNGLKLEHGIWRIDGEMTEFNEMIIGKEELKEIINESGIYPLSLTGVAAEDYLKLTDIVLGLGILFTIP